MVPVIGTRELRRMMDERADFVLIDALCSERYENIHLPGAINVPPGEIAYRIASVADPDTLLVVYSASDTCPFSATAVRILEELGYTNVCRFEDGIAGWTEEGFELEPIPI